MSRLPVRTVDGQLPEIFGYLGNLTCARTSVSVPPRMSGGAMARWEVEDEDWENIRERLRLELIGVAQNRSLTSYGKLVRITPELDGPQSHAFHEMLGEIGDACHAERMLLLSALVTYDEPTRGPGPGFYAAAGRLGFPVGSNQTARMAFWAQHVGECYDKWRGRIQ
jgi:hypothetical protein